MNLESITEEPTLVIRRLILAPQEATFWHIDQCRRFTVVVSGDRLRIEYLASGTFEEFEVTPGAAGWDDPEPRTHRAVNVGNAAYEEVVTFYRPFADVDPQPVTTPTDVRNDAAD